MNIFINNNLRHYFPIQKCLSTAELLNRWYYRCVIEFYSSVDMEGAPETGNILTECQKCDANWQQPEQATRRLIPFHAHTRDILRRGAVDRHEITAWQRQCWGQSWTWRQQRGNHTCLKRWGRGWEVLGWPRGLKHVQRWGFTSHPQHLLPASLENYYLVEYF